MKFSTSQQKSINFLFLILTVVLMSCGQGFELRTDLRSESSIQGPSSETRPLPNPSENSNPLVPLLNQWKPELEARIDGGHYNDMPVVHVLADENAIAFDLPLPLALPGTQFEPSSYPGIRVESRVEREQWLVRVTIPVKYLIKHSEMSPSLTLPNGDPVPGMPSGELRGFSLSLMNHRQHRIHFYFSGNAVGIFAETPGWRINDELSTWVPVVQIPLRNRSGNRVVGFFSIVPNKGQHASGVFISSRIPTRLAFELNQILRY